MIDSYDGVDYSLWPIFGGVEEYFLKDIILLHIFGNTGNSAIFVTKDDEVYAVGENVAGFLGIGEIERTGSPIRLDLLCGKHVQGFASGTTHSVAYTREGELYSWGDNNLGKLGNGTIICRDSPGRVLLPEGVKVIQAACADRYSAAITSEFKVLHWGDIEWSNGTSQTLPSYLQFPENVRIFNLCCGAFHAVALSSDCQVYTWGCGDMGQLGHRRISDVEMIPRLVEGQLTGLLIKEITCTMLASVVLTLDGRVYAWGHNRDGVLGLAMDIETIPTPQQVKIEEEYIKSIAAANMGSIITAVSETNVYKWGMDETRIGVFISKVDKVSWNVPYTVQVNNILNAFASSPIPRSNRITLEKIRNNLKEEKNLSLADDGIVLRDIGNALYNNKEYSDLTLRLSDGVVYVHKLILCSFCEHFKSMLDGPWAENGKKEIDLTRYNPQAYRAFVKYIYTGKLDQTLNGSQLIELCDIAESYFENDLKRMVITKFPSCLTEENVAELYCTAYSQPCEDIKELCCNFVSTRLEEVILTDGFDNLKGDLCKSLVKRAIQIKKNNPTLRKIVKVLFE